MRYFYILGYFINFAENIVNCYGKNWFGDDPRWTQGVASGKW